VGSRILLVERGHLVAAADHLLIALRRVAQDESAALLGQRLQRVLAQLVQQLGRQANRRESIVHVDPALHRATSPRVT
jgi:hypothetical protein